MLLKLRNRPERHLQAVPLKVPGERHSLQARRELDACAAEGAMPFPCSAAGVPSPPRMTVSSRVLRHGAFFYALVAGCRTSHGRSRRQGTRSQNPRVRTTPSGLRESPAITSRSSQPRLSCDAMGKPGRSGESILLLRGKKGDFGLASLYSRSRSSSRGSRAPRESERAAKSSLPHLLLYLLCLGPLYTLIRLA